jgi:hypothetical protein
MPVITSEPNQIFVEDVAFSASVSEAVGNKIGATVNYILSYFEKYSFGITGGFYSLLTTPYSSIATEIVRSNCVITDIFVTQAISGTSGQTEFYILKNGVSIFSVNGVITSAAADDLSFFALTGSTPGGVTKPVLTSTSLSAGDVLQFVLFTASVQGRNIQLDVITRPV